MRGVSFDLPDPDLEQYTWAYENEHGPASQPPLLRGGAFPPTPEDDGPPARLVINGYTYVRTSDSGDMQPPFDLPDVGDQSALGLWRNKWLPRVEALFVKLMTFDASSVGAGEWESTLNQQASDFGRVFAGVHGQTVVPSGVRAERFVEKYTDCFGEERREDGLALLQGFPNRTLDRALAAWKLGRTVHATNGLKTDLESARGGGEISDAAFAEQFGEFLENHGHTIDAGIADAPTWLEDPRLAIELILRFADKDEEASPKAAADRRVKRRHQLEEELRAAATNGSEEAELLETLPAAQEILAVREDHNTLCDQRLLAASRRRWLVVGEMLRSRGLAEDPSDIFYFQLQELYAALDHGRSIAPRTIDERRVLQKAYRAAQPPPFLGKLAAAARLEKNTLKGVAASPGRQRGVGRLIRSLNEADRLKDGDIIVCSATSPTWTPYFAVAGAVVTDAGGALSHTSVVAREYGIPAVVGTRTGTADIPDGALIEVDGTAGTVVIL